MFNCYFASWDRSFGETKLSSDSEVFRLEEGIKPNEAFNIIKREIKDSELYSTRIVITQFNKV